MKNILFIVLSLCFFSPDLRAKDKEKEEEPVKIVLVKEENSDAYFYEGVVPVEGVTKEEIYNRGKKWILTNLKTTDNNINFDDVNFSIISSSNIILKPLRTYFIEAVMTFKMSVDVKDNRYKIRFDNVVAYMKKAMFYEVEEISYSKMQTDDRRSYRKINKNLSDQINVTIAGIIEKFENAVKVSDEKNKSNW